MAAMTSWLDQVALSTFLIFLELAILGYHLLRQIGMLTTCFPEYATRQIPHVHCRMSKLH
jgi:hypothetical protein